MFSIPRPLALDYALAHAWTIVQTQEHTLQEEYMWTFKNLRACGSSPLDIGLWLPFPQYLIGLNPHTLHDFLFVEASSAIARVLCFIHVLCEADAGSSGWGGVGQGEWRWGVQEMEQLSNLSLLCGGLEPQCFGLLFCWDKWACLA